MVGPQCSAESRWDGHRRGVDVPRRFIVTARRSVTGEDALSIKARCQRRVSLNSRPGVFLNSRHGVFLNSRHGGGLVTAPEAVLPASGRWCAVEWRRQIARSVFPWESERTGRRRRRRRPPQYPVVRELLHSAQQCFVFRVQLPPSPTPRRRRCRPFCLCPCLSIQNNLTTVQPKFRGTHLAAYKQQGSAIAPISHSGRSGR